MKLKSPVLSPSQWEHLKLHGWVHVDERNPGTGYVGFQPAATPRDRQRRKAGKVAAQGNAKQKFGGK